MHDLKRTKEAWNALLPVVDKFPDRGSAHTDQRGGGGG
jgi:hypothetical protein